MPLENGKNLLAVERHPLLDLRAFVTDFPAPLRELSPRPELEALFSLEATAPLKSDDAVRRVVRDLLRHGGFKPTGRNKPASEYLIRAVRDGVLSSINLAVDVCNAVSLHSGLPISVVDLARISHQTPAPAPYVAPWTASEPTIRSSPCRKHGSGRIGDSSLPGHDLRHLATVSGEKCGLYKASEPLRVAVADSGETYVFNPAGQTIDVSGLICLHDADGPSANAVKDAQRTKTDGTTRRTLTLIWGTNELAGRSAESEEWYRSLLEQHGASTQSVWP